MNQRSGFVPIRFDLTGTLLLVIGIVGLIVSAIDAFSGWLNLSMIIPIMSLVFCLVGLYLRYIVPREPETKS